MISTVSRTVFLGAALLLMTPFTALTIPAISCHCFKDLSYDAGKPAAADPYFLAAAQNTFMAAVFNADKKSIVMMKQRGIPTDDLWIAYWVAAKSGADPGALLEARAKSNSWQEALTPLQPSPEKCGARFTQVLAATLPTDRLGAAVVDELLIDYRLLDENQLDALRKTATSNQELILAAVLATRTRRAVQQIIVDAKGGTKTWGAMMETAGIDGNNLPQAVAAVLKRSDIVTSQTNL